MRRSLMHSTRRRVGSHGARTPGAIYMYACTFARMHSSSEVCLNDAVTTAAMHTSVDACLRCPMHALLVRVHRRAVSALSRCSPRQRLDIQHTADLQPLLAGSTRQNQGIGDSISSRDGATREALKACYAEAWCLHVRMPMYAYMNGA
jgi:hypothetical protein